MEQLVVRKDMDVNEHERLYNFALGLSHVHLHPCPFLLQAVPLFNLCLSVM
jgi:hypothetical protein